MSVYLDNRPLTDTVRDVFTVDGALTPRVAVAAPIPRANAAGAIGSTVTLAPRQITVALDVWPDSLPDRVATMDAIARRVHGLRLFRMDDAPDRECYVTCDDVRVEFYHICQPRCVVTLVFTAVVPTRYDR